MKTYYFTFMLKQEGVAEYLQPIVAKDVMTARQKMFDMYGENWCFCYEEKPEYYKDAPELKTVYAEGYKVNPLYVETKTKRLQLVLQPSLFNRVKKGAKQAGLSVNEYVHRILDEATKGEEQKLRKEVKA